MFELRGYDLMDEGYGARIQACGTTCKSSSTCGSCGQVQGAKKARAQSAALGYLALPLFHFHKLSHKSSEQARHSWRSFGPLPVAAIGAGARAPAHAARGGWSASDTLPCSSFLRGAPF
eukprot:scaffold9886_cov105-Isochrysis_galbana.AAC.1